MKGALGRLGRALAEEWYGAVPSEHDVIEVELISCRGREVARVEVDRNLLEVLRRVRRRSALGAVSTWDLEGLDTVIGTLAARCSGEGDEGSTP